MSRIRPLPVEFLDWQVALRRHTMRERNGAPHIGVVPLVTVRRPGPGLGVVSHSVVCGLLPRAERLEACTREFRGIYEGRIAEGARAVYDRGIARMLDYYTSSDAFDPDTVTTLLPVKTPLVDALRAEPRCALVFHVFDPQDKTQVGEARCQQLDARAEVLESGPVYDNVWWHNSLFHGPADGCAVIRFRHERSWDTRFGGFEPLAG